MDESVLKTSWKQRLIIGLIGVLLLGATVAVYVMIVLGNDNVNYSKMTTDQLQTAYEKTMSDINARGAELSDKYFEEFKSYKSNIKAFNSSTANSNGVQSKDLKEGDGAAVSAADGYSAYYIGYCSDESVFDSSFDNADEPTALNAPLSVTENNLIEGWYLGTDGMKLGGVREVTIPGALAYGESQEICGNTNSPLKFIIYAIEKDDQLAKLNDKIEQIYTALIQAYSASYSSDSSSIDYSEDASEEE